MQPLPSVTVTAIGNEPVCVGVPERTPAVDSVMPVGSALAVVNVAPPIAPVCVNVWLNAVAATPLLTPGFVTLIDWQVMFRSYLPPVPVHPLPSVTVTMIENKPVCVGVPDSRPAADSVIPAGSVLAVVNVAPPIAPVCVNVWLNAVAATPLLTPGFVTLIVWQPTTSVYVPLVPTQLFASVTVTTIGNEPTWVGVPESVPFAASVMPAGSVLAVVNVAPPTAPVCVKF